ncbi:hypothetical protein Tco_0890294 [Tanacetum coccineum]|uniref:Uncharacterized protein n=1 Tax=Tanacetum coccineum TaxID=301880 RepID=A0ABQ5C2P8_9ASTR
MTTLQFADTHNLVAFLSKPAESEGFEQIVDFLNANPIKYALTINPTIYTSCIEQFWATVKVKTINGEVQLQALVDGKKIIVTEASVRRDLQLNDEEGTDCFPNATMFEEHTRMGYEKLSQKLTFYKAFISPQWKFLIHTILQCLSAKTTAWNKFSSPMASAIICLATNQKFNFSKYIFESMVKNLENVSGKFLMYPRFVQVFLEKQLEGMSNHKRIYVTPSHTKKIFGSMRRVGKGFSGRETPLFLIMVVQAQEEMGEDEAVNEEMDDSLERAATTTTSLDAKRDRGNILKTQSKETPNEPSSLGTSSGGGPRHQETIGDTIAQTRFENVSKTSNDSLLAGVNTPRSDEDSLKLKELMELCTNLQNRVIDLEKTKTSQAQEIISLKRRVKRLEKKGGSRTYGLKRLYKVGLSRRLESSEDEGLGEEDASKQGRIDDIDANAGINLVSTHFDVDTDMFGVHDLVGDKVIVETEVASKDVNLSVDEVTLAQALAALKSAKPKPDKVMLQESEQGTITTTTAATIVTVASIRPKAKGLVIHEEKQETTPTVSFQQPSQVKVQDKGKGVMLQAEFDEEVRLAREKAEKEEEANIVSWDNMQAMIDADYQMATNASRRTRKVEVNTFVDMDTELVEGSEVRAEGTEGSSKRAGEELEQESSKKQKLEDEKETAELKSLMEVIPDKEEVAIDAIPLATKPPSIVDYKIHKEGKKTYYQIIRADGSSKMYLVFSHRLKSFDREDLETLWKMVKAKHGSTRPEEGYERVL